MVKIIFVIPPYFNADDYITNDKAAVLPAFTVPYGILSLEAYLNKKSTNPVRVEVCDLNITLHKLIKDGYTI